MPPLNLDALSGPFSQVETTQGTMYIYPLTVKNLQEASSENSPEIRGRRMLRELVSKTKRSSFKDEIERLAESVVDDLTDDDITAIADAFREGLPKGRYLEKNETPPVPVDPRREGESPLAYLDRVIVDEITSSVASTSAAWKKATASIGGTVGNLFKELQGTSDQLGKTVREAKLLAVHSPIETHVSLAHFDTMEHVARARNEEREWARINLQMTTESAEMLKKLVDSAGAMMLRWDTRDRIGDSQLKIQLWIAIGSLVVATMLSGLSTWYGRYSLLSYEYQLEKDATDAKNVAAASAREDRLNRVLEQNSVLLEKNAQLMQQLVSQRGAAPQKSNPSK